MEVTLAVAAQDVREREGGIMDIFGVFDEMMTSELPCIVESMIVVVALSADAAEVGFQRSISIPLMAPDGKEIGTASQVFVVPEARREGSRPHLNLGFRLRNVLFPEAGPHHFSIKIGEDVKTTVPLYISVREGDTQ